MSGLRLLTDFFDYSCRREVKEPDGNLQLASDYLSRIRLDAALFGTIVLTDAQLFHSAFFSDLIFESIDGRPVWQLLPVGVLEVRLRAPTLEASIMKMVQPSGGVGNHLFTYLDPTGLAASELNRTFKNTAPSSIGAVLDVLNGALRGTRFHKRVERAVEATSLLIEMVDNAHRRGESRVFTPEPWGEFPEFAERSKHALDYYFDRASLDTDRGNAWLGDLKSNRTSRALLVRELLAQDDRQTLPADEVSDLNRIEQAHSLIYNRFIARQHKCSNVDLSVKPRYVPTGQEGLSTIDARSIDMPRWFRAGLARIQPKHFELVLEETLIHRRQSEGGELRATPEIARVLVEMAEKFLTAPEREQLSREKAAIAQKNRYRRRATTGGFDVVSKVVGPAGPIVDFVRDEVVSILPDPSVDEVKQNAVVTVTEYLNARLDGTDVQ